MHRSSPFIITSSDHGTMIVNRKDVADREHGKIGVGHQILEYQSFDISEVRMVRDLLTKRRDAYGPGVVALDLGANIGVHTIEWARLMSGWGSVEAFEAQERIYYALAGNIAINNCFNASATFAAIGKAVGSILVPELDYNSPASFGSLELRKSSNNEPIGQDVSYEESASSSVRMVTIDSLDKPRLDFIKIDIEGMEIEALQGARETLKKCKPMLLIEHIKSDRQALVKILENSGYKCFSSGMNTFALHKDDRIKANPR